jgi:cyclic nucleotide gated channel
MFFIVRGTAKSQYRLLNNQTSDFALGPGDFFGDELITWCLGKAEQRLPLSSATLITTEMTEAFSLKAQDLKYITEHFRYVNIRQQHQFLGQNIVSSSRARTCILVFPSLSFLNISM